MQIVMFFVSDNWVCFVFLICLMGFFFFFLLQVFQLRVSFVKDAQKQEEMWERQHELAADKIYAMCADLGGFFLKVTPEFEYQQGDFLILLNGLCCISLNLLH